jgi:hypothetical protein
MSSVSIQGNASGTGIFTIASPNSSTNRTLTLPDATGTIITTAGGAAISGTTGSFSGDLSFNSGYGSAAVAYGCRAWVNFNGTGTPAIRASGNVTSITDNGTGDYTVNFTTAMPDANYSPQITCGTGLGDISGTATTLVGSCRFRTYNDAGASVDPVIGSVSIFR